MNCDWLCSAPNAVFLPSSPLNSAPLENSTQQKATSVNKTVSDQPITRSPLESIAEIIETPSAHKEPETSHEDAELDPQKHSDESKRKKLSLLYPKSSPSGLVHQTSGSVSPIEANASIDLSCDLPASASIDIMDHNLKPIDRIASVLHPTAGGHSGELPKSGPSPPKITQFIEGEPSEQGDQVSKQQDNNHVSAIGSPDSVDSEEAAAIRIQSAFRGYRSRKNSPYRTRSPTSSPASLKRNNLRQQEAAVLLEEENDSSAAAMVAGEDSLVNGDQVSRSEGRRLSRPRQRDELAVVESTEERLSKEAADGNEKQVTEDLREIVEQGGCVIESATSSSIDDTTVKEISEALLDQQVGTNAEQSALISQTEQCENDRAPELPAIQLGLNGIQLPATPSLSLKIGESELSATSAQDEQNLSAALEAFPAGSATINYADELDDGSNLPLDPATRPSIGSAETDSSVLGAALSEELSEEAAPAAAPPSSDRFKPIDEDKLREDVSMTTEELESEARRLVDEITGESQQPLGQAFNQMEAALEDTTADSFAANESVLLNEEEQRAIELESDDIERRDPRGQVSVERVKSPQIRTEEPSFAQEQAGYAIDGSQQEEEPVQEQAGSSLNVEQPDELGGSGRSSPACNSSGCGSSSSNLDRNELEEEGRAGAGGGGSSKQNEANQKRQPVGSSATPIGRNKKRNRNKKKGKK